MNLYLNMTQQAAPGTVSWAWLRLGLSQLKRKDVSNAIKSFQAALRGKSDD